MKSETYANKNLFLIRDLSKEKKWGEPRIYWCANGKGYTPELEDAGRFTAIEADNIVANEPDRLKVVNLGRELTGIDN